MFLSGELIKVVNFCHGLKVSYNVTQMKLPGIYEEDLHELTPGDIGIVVGSSFYEEVGWLVEAIFGDIVLADILSENVTSAGAI